MTPPFVDAAHIRRQADGGAYERGEAYFAGGAVQQVTWDPTTSVIESVVVGSAGRSYRCRIRLDPQRPDRPVAATSCTCPVQFDCKHTVATLLASNRLAQQAPVREASSWRAVLAPAEPTPHATTALALGVELRQRVRHGASAWVPARVETATARGLHQHGADVLVGLRPLERSDRSETWIKGSVSWDALRRPNLAYEPGQSRWFAELYSIARDIRLFGAFSDASEWLTLDDVESSLLWPHLMAGRDHRIALVPTKRTATVSVAGEASVAVRARASAAGLEIDPVFTIDGEAADVATLRPVGRSGIYRFTVRGDRIDLTLAPLSLPDPVHALLASRERVTIPPAETDEFVREHLPRIVRHVAVDAPGIDVPPPPRPRLVVSVRFAPSHRLDYALAWRYGAAEPRPFDLDSASDRDEAAEAEIHAYVQALWNDASPVAFAATGTLSGMDAAEFASRLLPALEAAADVEVHISGERPRYRELTGDPRISVSTVESTDADWFDLGVVVAIDGRRIPFATLFTALSRGRKKVLLSDGAFFSLSHPALQRLRDLIDEAGELEEWETGPRLSRYQTDLWAEFEDLADEAAPAVAWRETARGLRDADGIPSLPMPQELQADLRPYQRAGFEWLAFLWSHRLGGILADDMGLGKTLQMLALIARTREAGERRPFLVVAPTSVLSTWRTEAARFTPGLRVTVIDSTRTAAGSTVEREAATADLVVTSYTLLRLDEPQFASVAWAGLILDEAQFVKNSRTKTYRAVQSLDADVVFAITGTPLENSLTELWALLSLTAPGLFASARRFREEYVGPIEKGKVPENQDGGAYRAARLARLRRRIRPLVLRRTKELVAADLPAKQEQEVRIELSAAHRALYDTVLQRERQKVLGLLDDLDRNRFIVFRSLTLLRMLSLAPGLIDPAHAHIPPSKLTALFEQLDEALAEGHRALVFSQFTSFLGLVAARLEERGIPYAYLDGSTRDRDGAVAAFRGGEAPVFLISLKAGGFGLTLTEADYVFLLDPWWNPAAEAQAVDRAHRIGQARNVMVYRLIANGTIEEKVMALQQRKARLFRSVMDDDALFGKVLDAEDIRGLFEV